MIDPLLSLAFSLHSNRGVFALLLGSGISRPAGIPTGWEIVLDLIRKLAKAKRANCEPDPAAWYSKTYSANAEYSSLLNGLARSPAERQQLLKVYFEPTEDERSEGLKMPTSAHHAVAHLVSTGHVRVIITTNFDRLMERALDAIGITPVVISTADAVEGAVPLTHLQCAIIKPNGDYLDSRIKNTEGELSHYPPAMRRLLRQILDEYGLIICGWSAEWDSGLRSLIEQTPNRRFTTFWATRSDLSPRAQSLATLRRSELIRINSADQFFTELSEKARSLDQINSPHPLSGKTAAATVKRYVLDPLARIRLHDFFVFETDRLCSSLTAEYFSHGTPPEADEINRRCRQFESLAEVLLSSMPVVVSWGEAMHIEWLVKSIERIGNQNVELKTSGTFYPDWQRLHRYPALLLVFATSLSGLASGKLAATHRILTSPRSRTDNHTAPLLLKIWMQSVSYPVDEQTGKANLRKYHYLGPHLRKILRPFLHDLIPDEQEYTATFHRLEYLIGLVVSDLSDGNYWWPADFARQAHYMPDSPVTILDNELSQLSIDHPLLRAGFCGGSLERLKFIKAKLDEHLAKMGW